MRYPAQLPSLGRRYLFSGLWRRSSWGRWSRAHRSRSTLGSCRWSLLCSVSRSGLSWCSVGQRKRSWQRPREIAEGPAHYWSTGVWEYGLRTCPRSFGTARALHQAMHSPTRRNGFSHSILSAPPLRTIAATWCPVPIRSSSRTNSQRACRRQARQLICCPGSNRLIG